MVLKLLEESRLLKSVSGRVVERPVDCVDIRLDCSFGAGLAASVHLEAHTCLLCLNEHAPTLGNIRRLHLHHL